MKSKLVQRSTRSNELRNAVPTLGLRLKLIKENVLHTLVISISRLFEPGTWILLGSDPIKLKVFKCTSRDDCFVSSSASNKFLHFKVANHKTGDYKCKQPYRERGLEKLIIEGRFVSVKFWRWSPHVIPCVMLTNKISCRSRLLITRRCDSNNERIPNIARNKEPSDVAQCSKTRHTRVLNLIKWTNNTDAVIRYNYVCNFIMYVKFGQSLLHFNDTLQQIRSEIPRLQKVVIYGKT